MRKCFIFMLLIVLFPSVVSTTYDCLSGTCNSNVLLTCSNDARSPSDDNCRCYEKTSFTTDDYAVYARYFEKPDNTWGDGYILWEHNGKSFLSSIMKNNELDGNSGNCWAKGRTLDTIIDTDFDGDNTAVSGTWTATLMRNGNPVGSPTTFTITDSSAQTYDDCYYDGNLFLAHGSNGYYYSASYVGCGETCQGPVYVSCNDGTLTPSGYYYSSCTEETNCQTEPYCGDGVVNGYEQCDGSNLAGATCQSTIAGGYDYGTLSCYSPDTHYECRYDTSGCHNCPTGQEYVDGQCTTTDTTCTAGQTSWCDTGEQGVCLEGTKTCTDGEWGECVQDTQAQSSEQNCDDAYDDDCDGFTDAYDSDCGGTTPITTISGNLIYQSGTKKLKYTDTTSASSFSTYDMYVKIYCDASEQAYSSGSHTISSQSDSKYFYVSTLLSSISSQTTCTAYAYSESNLIAESSSFTYYPTTQVAECGNGDKEGDEQCDGYDLPYTNCAYYDSDLYSSGTLSCDTDCTYNLENCESLPIDTDTETDDDFDVEIVDSIDDIIDDSESESDVGTTDDISQDLIDFYDENSESKECTFIGDDLSNETDCTENDLLFCYSSLYNPYDAQNTCKCAEVKKMGLLI